MISREELEAYDKAFQALTDGAKKALNKALTGYISANGDATVGELREFAIEALRGHVGVSNQQAATLAADWYDKLMKQEGLKLAPAELADAVPDEVITKAAHYQAGKLVDGDTEAFVDACTDLLEHSMKRSLNDTVSKNVARDKKRGIRYARVPMGGETCAFCLMLASRGFVYSSASTAGEGVHYHKSCRCKAVPGVQGVTKVAGYSPDRLYKLYKGKQTATSSDNHKPIAAGQIYLNRSTELFRRMEKVTPIDGYVDIGAHSDGLGMIYTDIDDKKTFTMSNIEFAEVIRTDPRYKPGEKIRLIACNAGKFDDGFAQAMADELGVEILAPDQFVYIDFDGRMILAKSDNEYKKIIIGATRSTGTWRTFVPRV